MVENDIVLLPVFFKRLKIIPYRLILILCPVFGGCHSGIFLENITEIMRIVIARFTGNSGVLVIGGTKKLLCLTEP